MFFLLAVIGAASVMLSFIGLVAGAAGGATYGLIRLTGQTRRIAAAQDGRRRLQGQHVPGYAHVNLAGVRLMISSSSMFCTGIYCTINCSWVLNSSATCHAVAIARVVQMLKLAWHVAGESYYRPTRAGQDAARRRPGGGGSDDGS